MAAFPNSNLEAVCKPHYSLDTRLIGVHDRDLGYECPKHRCVQERPDMCRVHWDLEKVVSVKFRQKDLVSTWLRTLSSIAASCSTNKVSWRVKLCSGCREVSFEFSEFSEAAASSFHTCTLDSGLLSVLLGGVFIAPASGLLAPAVLWSSQLEG